MVPFKNIYLLELSIEYNFLRILIIHHPHTDSEKCYTLCGPEGGFGPDSAYNLSASVLDKHLLKNVHGKNSFNQMKQ